MPEAPLPIEGIREELTAGLAAGPVVITAPTGSGKSTQVPRWCGASGQVLVVEPRRVACRGLAQRVASLEGTPLGDGVGYSVRDDSRSRPTTRIVFATPGVVLRWIAADALPRFDTVIVDELHERGLDVDLILALTRARFEGQLVVMSATLDGERVARYLGGRHIHAPGRVFPVRSEHVPGKALLPDVRGLESRIHEALRAARDDEGDVLVFLPGKAEIARAAESLRGVGGFEVLAIHGGLELAEQSRVFEPGKGRRIILATNVAETSITIPGVGVVIDSGLVRRTRYVNGRGFLTLVPVALDSAEQRAGRAGRTAPGACYRLWDPQARLEPTTPPEIHREALAPLMIAAAACGARMDDLEFLDAPRDYALAAAAEELSALGAVDPEERITDRGRRLFGMPLDAPLGALLVEAEREGCLPEAIDLVSVLAVGRPLFAGGRPEDEALDLRASGCDATAAIRALREGRAREHRLSGYVVGEARRISRRLRAAFELPAKRGAKEPFRRRSLGRAALRADPRSAYVARQRRGRTYFGNGGPEIELARESAVEGSAVKAIAVLGSMAVGHGYRDQRIFATCAMPLELSQLAEAGLGEDRVEHAAPEKGAVTARVERVYAGQVLARREEIPEGELARSAIAELFGAGRLFPGALDATRNRLAAARLAAALDRAGRLPAELERGAWAAGPVPDDETWARERIASLGVTSGEDLSLLSAPDLTADDLPDETREWLDREYPRELRLGDGNYRVEYDLKAREATLVQTSGRRKDPPPLSILPSLAGFRIRVRHHSKVWVIRERR